MLFLSLFSLLPYVIYRLSKRKERESGNFFGKKSMLLIVIYTAFIVLSEITAYRCTAMIPIIVQAPLSFTTGLIFTGIADFVCFKAVPSKNQLVQMVLAVICSVCFVL